MRFSLFALSLFAFTTLGCGDKETDDSAAANDTAKTDDSQQECNAPESCATFCATMQSTCAGTYQDETTCNEVCANFAPGCDGDTSGNTLGCRAYHAGAAATDPTTHCPHAGESGEGVCVD